MGLAERLDCFQLDYDGALNHEIQAMQTNFNPVIIDEDLSLRFGEKVVSLKLDQERTPIDVFQKPGPKRLMNPNHTIDDALCKLIQMPDPHIASAIPISPFLHRSHKGMEGDPVHRHRRIRREILALVGLCLTASISHAQTLTIDATAPVAPAETGFLKQGTNVSPTGRTIGATSRYLLRDGKPWLPVMGEFHFSRYPETEWEKEILKMKAGGVQIVASYVIWIHHEEEQGEFDWSGQRNLRRFVELVGKHGLYAYPRIGPWSHAEVRHGGFPDWLVRIAGANLRSNDSTYLMHVGRYYRAIAEQLRGTLWKDGGPVIGIQLENEYNQRGHGRGEEHVLMLKRIALQAGFDVPLYTVTGWDNAVLPPAEVIPVFGGYPDMPWDASIEELPPGEVYAFRFDNRWAGNMGAQGPAQQLDPTAQGALVRYPFLGAEYGGGIQITYHRRPVISADDIAAMLPVQIGSGVNLYGYYMFHGGTNPEGKLSTLQESQRTGYPTDVPVKSYDFQTLLGEFGEMRPSFRKTKIIHYFLNEFGDLLAPMVPRRPDRVPANPADTSVIRVAARTAGNQAFVFLNNYIRNYAMPARENVQIELRLPDKTLRVPAQPIDVPSGVYAIWPVNLDVNGALLEYSTAQLVTRISSDDMPVYFFVAVPGIAAEFVFDDATTSALDAPHATVTRASGRRLVRGLRAGTSTALTVRAQNGRSARVVLLTQQQAENFWRVNVGGVERAILSEHEIFSDGETLHVRAKGSPDFSVAVYPALQRVAAPFKPVGSDGIFTRYNGSIAPKKLMIATRRARAADPIPPVRKFNAVTWRRVEIALAPSDSAFDAAARYSLQLPPDALERLDDVILEISYVGDVARLYAGDALLNDNFFNGTPWRIGLGRYAEAVKRGQLELRILPLRSDAPIYIPAAYRPTFTGQRAELLGVNVIPVYGATLRP